MRLLSTNKDEGFIQRVGRRGMQQLSPSLLELGAETHDELVHTACLIIATATATGAGLRAGEKLSSMDSAVRRCECVNLTPKPTEPAVELIYGVFPLLNTTEGLVQDVELCLIGAAVAAL